MFVQKAEPLYLEEAPEKGLPTFFAENYDAAYNDMYTNNSTMSLQYEFYDAYSENIRTIEKLSGQKLGKPINVEVFFGVASDLEGVEGDYNPIRTKSIRSIHEQNEQIKLLKEQYPEIKTLDELWGGVKQNAVEVEATALGASADSTLGGSVGGFAGAMAGSFTMRDPFNLATLNVGGFGRTLGLRLLTEFGAQGAIESVNELFGVRQNRDLLGLDNSIGRTVSNIAAAGVGGAALRGASEGAAALSNKLLLNKLEKTFKKPTTEQKTAMDALEREVVFTDEANPFGDTIDDEILHLQKMREAEEFLENPTPAGRERLDEAPPIRDEDVIAQMSRADEELEVYSTRAKAIKNELESSVGIDLKNPKSLKGPLGYVPESLADFVRTTGGISDAGGDLAAKGIDNKSTKEPFKRSLIRDEDTVATGQGTVTTKNSIDEVKRRVHDAGYFPEKAHYDEIGDEELLDALARDLDPKTDKIYSEDDMAAIQEKSVNDVNVSKYDEVGITEDMSVEQIAKRLQEEDLYSANDGSDGGFDARAHDEQLRYEAEQMKQGGEYLDDVANDYVDSQLASIKAPDEVKFNPDEEVVVGYKIGDDGVQEAEVVKLGDLVKSIEEGDALVDASKGCVL